MIYKFFKIFGLLTGVALIIYFFFTVRIGDIICVSQLGECPTEVINQIQNQRPFTFLNVNRKLSGILKNDIRISEYGLEFAISRKVTIHIIEKKPVFALTNEGAESRFLVDQHGLILYSGSSSLPTLIVEKTDYKAGEKVSQDTLFALEIVNALSRNYQFDGAFLKQGRLEINFHEGLTAIFPTSGDKNLLTGSFVLIYNQLNKGDNEFRIEGSRVSLIDLRFRNPVLKKVS